MLSRESAEEFRLPDSERSLMLNDTFFQVITMDLHDPQYVFSIVFAFPFPSRGPSNYYLFTLEGSVVGISCPVATGTNCPMASANTFLSKIPRIL